MTACICILACNFSGSKKNDSALVAEAFGHELYLSEIEPYLLNEFNASDSQYTISQYVDKWLMEVILLEEAEKKIKDRVKINELVESYKQSLIVQELESNYVNEALDTLVSSSEIDTFFKYHKEDFRLHEGIMRLLFIKIPTTNNNDTLENLWETEDLPALKQFSSSNNGFALVDAEEWYQLSFLKNILPTEIYAKVSLKKADTYEFDSNDQHFYLKVLEIVNENDEVPVSYVKERIKLRIIQDRIQALLKKKKSALFNAKIKSKQIKIYGKDNG